jgi:hypothetical protein
MPAAPWPEIKKNPIVYFDTTLLPRDMKLRDPDEMSVAEVWALIAHIQESQTDPGIRFGFNRREEIVRRLERQPDASLTHREDAQRYVHRIETCYHTHARHHSTNAEGPAPKSMPERSQQPQSMTPETNTTDWAPGQHVGVSDWGSTLGSESPSAQSSVQGYHLVSYR